jgi:hypothetical protein
VVVPPPLSSSSPSGIIETVAVVDDAGVVVATLVAGATVVVGRASGFVVGGVDCGEVPPGEVDSLGAGLVVPAAPIQETTSPLL